MAVAELVPNYPLLFLKLWNRTKVIDRRQILTQESYPNFEFYLSFLVSFGVYMFFFWAVGAWSCQ